jgi:predicted nucleotidyltransferase
MSADDLVLSRYRAELHAAYGERLVQVRLYGSRARGDTRADSDYDVAVFLTDVPDFWFEVDHLAAISTNVLYATGAVVNALPFRADAYQDRTPLMHEIRRDGVAL